MIAIQIVFYVTVILMAAFWIAADVSGTGLLGKLTIKVLSVFTVGYAVIHLLMMAGVVAEVIIK